jgi:hypothetical protein
MATRKTSTKLLASIRPGDGPLSGPVAESDPEALPPLQELLAEAVVLQGINLSLRYDGGSSLIHGGHVVSEIPPGDLPAEARPAFDALSDMIRVAAELSRFHGILLELDLLSKEGLARLCWGLLGPEAAVGGPPAIESLPVPIPVGWRPPATPQGYPEAVWDQFVYHLERLQGAVASCSEAQLFVRTERSKG